MIVATRKTPEVAHVLPSNTQFMLHRSRRTRTEQELETRSKVWNQYWIQIHWWRYPTKNEELTSEISNEEKPIA